MTSSLITADFVVRNIGVLATLRGPVPRVGAALRDLGLVERAAVAARDGRVVWTGAQADLAGAVAIASGASVLDAGGGAVVPGLVDAHTHLAYAGDRDDEIQKRLAGASYKEIAAVCGCALGTVMSRLFRARRAVAQQLQDYARERKWPMERFE